MPIKYMFSKAAQKSREVLVFIEEFNSDRNSFWRWTKK